MREYFGPEVWIIADQAGRGLQDFEGQYLEPDYVSLNVDSHLYQVRLSALKRIDMGDILLEMYKNV